MKFNITIGRASLDDRLVDSGLEGRDHRQRLPATGELDQHHAAQLLGGVDEVPGAVGTAPAVRALRDQLAAERAGGIVDHRDAEAEALPRPELPAEERHLALLGRELV